MQVETVGDCYVAVVGLPHARPDHAPAMARFAKGCHEAFREVVWKLQISLGPDTGAFSKCVNVPMQFVEYTHNHYLSLSFSQPIWLFASDFIRVP